MLPQSGSRSCLFAPAAAGTRVRVITMIAVDVAVVVAAIATIFFGTNPDVPVMPVISGMAAGVPFVFVVWFCSRIRAYQIVDGVLRVIRPLHTAKFPLVNLEHAEADRNALAGARQVIGNRGLGVIAGRFRSRRLGAFRAYVSDPERAVVLRWPDRCVVLSPENPALFVEVLRGRCDGKGAD